MEGERVRASASAGHGGRASPLSVLVILLLAITLVGVALLLSTKQDANGQTESRPEAPPVAGESREQASIVATSPTELSRSVAEAAPLWVRVVDTRGEPIMGAGVWLAAGVAESQSREWFDRAGGVMTGFLGDTAADGRLRIATVDPAHHLVVGKTGYVSQLVSSESDKEVVVQLVAGGRLTFECRNAMDDTPLSGVDVAVALSDGVDIQIESPRQRNVLRLFNAPKAQDLKPPSPDAVAAPPPAEILYLARSRADGVAEFTGLPPGRFWWIAWSERGLIVHDGPGLRGHDVMDLRPDGSRYSIKLAPLHAAALLVRGDEIVTWEAQAAGKRFGAPMPGAIMLQAGVDRLLRKHPGAIAVVDAPRHVTNAVFDVTLRSRGRHRIEVPMRPLSEVEAAPVIVDAASLADEGTRSRHVTLIIRNPDGGSVGPVRGAIWRESIKGVVNRVATGVPVMLPDGDYRWIPDQVMVQAYLQDGGRFRVGAGTVNAAGEIDLSLTAKLYEVRVTHTSTQRSLSVKVLPSQREFEVHLDGDGVTTLFLLDARRYEFWEGGSVVGEVDLNPQTPKLDVRLRAGG